MTQPETYPVSRLGKTFGVVEITDNGRNANCEDCEWDYTGKGLMFEGTKHAATMRHTVVIVERIERRIVPDKD